MLVTRAGHTFDVIGPDDDGWGFWDRFADGRWEPESFDVLDAYLGPHTTFVDVGAWIGPLTIYAARLGARVVALEPDPVARRFLRGNVRRNGGDVTIVSKAMTGRSGVGFLGEGREPGSKFGDSTSRMVPAGILAETITPEDLWEREGITGPVLVKIDVEGGEVDLVGHADFLRSFPLILSVHGGWLSAYERQSVGQAFSVDASGFASVFLPPTTG